MNETWRPATTDKRDWSDLYAVSSEGRVKRIAATVEHPRTGKRYTYPENVLTPLPNSVGHYQVQLSRPGAIRERVQVSRLVARAFLPDYAEGCDVHHVNGRQEDNAAENLVCLSKDAHRRAHKVLEAASFAVAKAIREGLDTVTLKLSWPDGEVKAEEVEERKPSPALAALFDFD
jgi:hypothetical protein